MECIEGTVEVPLSLQDPGRHDMQAMPVLREAHVLAEVPARLEMLPCRRQVAFFAEEVGETHVHVRRRPHHRLAGFCRQVQGPLVCLDRLAKPALRDPDIREGDRGTYGVRQAARMLDARHALGIDPVRSLEVTTGPQGQAQERLGPAAEEIAVGCQVEDLPRVRTVAAPSPLNRASTAR